MDGVGRLSACAHDYTGDSDWYRGFSAEIYETGLAGTERGQVAGCGKDKC